jgi:diguanylate cyclase (GGDEF)-like protein
MIGGGGLVLAMAFFALFSFRQFRLLDRFYRGNIETLELQKAKLLDLTASLEEAKATLEARVAERTRALEAANEALGRLAALDGLTGIPNRRSFDETLLRECRRAHREGIPLSCIMVDIDHFKAYNDTYGHQAGDDCLSQVAQALETCNNRPSDLVARYGGEEFGVILPATEAAGAHMVAERMRLCVAQLEIPHAGSSAAAHVTLSLGVATMNAGDASPESLLQAADRALYQAKRRGRNQVALAQAVVQEIEG